MPINYKYRETALSTSAEYLSFNVFSLRAAYLSKAICVTDVVNEVLSRIEKYKAHNIWISLQSSDSLMTQARALALQNPESLPLYGIPFAVKDNIDVIGVSTTAACPGFSYLPKQTAFAVQQLIEAGALFIGKTNMDQFATGLTGTRSPPVFGICKNALNPAFISGGSSSGSAVAVALNQVSFALGTDTAGSGRIPAAFNNIFGLKPSRGLISCSGVVPACKSLDCVSLFSHTAAEAEAVFQFLLGYDIQDSYTRYERKLLPRMTDNAVRPRFGVPKPTQLKFFGNLESADLFNQTIVNLQQIGDVVEIDFQPFLEAAFLLYDGPWIAERYAGIREFIASQPDQLHEVIATVLSGATTKTAIDAFTALHHLQDLKQQILPIMHGLTGIMVPTAPTIYTIAEVLADPIQLNSNLGYYTNYMNLLDLCAVAIPTGFYANGMPFGVTLFAEALADWRLLALAKHIEALIRAETVLQQAPAIRQDVTLATTGYRRIAVCGAHMQGLPLNSQLLALGGKFYGMAKTAANYRLFVLATPSPERPGLMRDEAHGQAIELELWDLPMANWAAFIAQINSPLCIGSVELADGSWQSGFLCEGYPLGLSVEISALGGWRNYLKANC